MSCPEFSCSLLFILCELMAFNRFVFTVLWIYVRIYLHQVKIPVSCWTDHRMCRIVYFGVFFWSWLIWCWNETFQDIRSSNQHYLAPKCFISKWSLVRPIPPTSNHLIKMRTGLNLHLGYRRQLRHHHHRNATCCTLRLPPADAVLRTGLTLLLLLLLHFYYISYFAVAPHLPPSISTDLSNHHYHLSMASYHPSRLHDQYLLNDNTYCPIWHHHYHHIFIQLVKQSSFDLNSAFYSIKVTSFFFYFIQRQILFSISNLNCHRWQADHTIEMYSPRKQT